MARKLATCQKIISIRPIEGADRIELATVLGWQVVVGKGTFKVGDWAIYFETDTIIPEFEFLKGEEYKFLREKKYRIRSVKIRGEYSHGLLLPYSILNTILSELQSSGNVLELPEIFTNPEFDKNDYDVSEFIGVKKYFTEDEAAEENETEQEDEEEIPQKNIWERIRQWRFRISEKYKFLSFLRPIKRKKKAKGFPKFIPKTDETRCQRLTSTLRELKGSKCYVCEKMEGSSVSYIFHEGEFMVCSRNVRIKDKNHRMWKYAIKHDLEKKFRNYCYKYDWMLFSKIQVTSLCLQGELIGQKIQGNLYDLEEDKVLFFSLFNIKEGHYADLHALERVCSDLGLETVPVIDRNFSLIDEINEIEKLSVGKSKLNPKKDREGIVIRKYHVAGEKGFSGKMINPEYSIKQK